MSTDQYILSETQDGSVTVTNNQNLVSSFPASGGGIGATKVDIIPVRSFQGMQSAVAVQVDNATEHGIYISSADIYVPPYTSGYVRNFAQPITQAYAQARNDSLWWTVPVGGETCTITFSDQKIGGESSGTPVPSVQTTVIELPSNYVVNGTSDPAGLRSGLDVAVGYDLNAAENGNFEPFRTPNVWMQTQLDNIPPNAEQTINIYTPPAGNYWHLLSLSLTWFGAGTGQRYWYLLDNGGSLQFVQGFPLLDFGAGGYLKIADIRYPGNGIKSNAPGTPFGMRVSTTQPNENAYVSVGLFVGS